MSLSNHQNPLPDADLERRFNGLARLYGVAGASKIRAAHVVVVGLGGVGSWAAEALARSGVARLTLIDLDNIAESNINRQIHALDSTLGQAKVQAMRERIAQINPDCDVRCIEEFVDASNWPAIAQLGRVQGQSGAGIAVIDACDQVRAKTAMAAWALQFNASQNADAKLHFISVGAAGGKREAHKVDIEDLSLTTHDPLLAQLRYRLRKEQGAARKGKIGVNCVFSREAVARPAPAARALIDENILASDQALEDKEFVMPIAASQNDDQSFVQSDNSLNCHGYGSVVSVTATFGICAAGWVLGKIAD
ncbi:tRNA threonylcarbamoyladenosine dehydratase [Polaromonas vacuolata]|uniref:tRNA threonylcarbamoyladenosine dehydratase n=1 Tax=Polaromonas vacuolata TaxID=37448 RepID=A0A6H2H9I6_9BURK|nr:tRNA threonylcarbamoyladenosine dehydratase [Polaromonas vacuolata]QJC56542.1 tRNA threonylcarbamoyladenosine dehydratase [Polaromonas vacuolata]